MDPRTKRTIIVCAILAVIAAVMLLLALGALEDALQRSRPGTGTANAATGTTTAAPKVAPRSAVRVLTPVGDPDDPDDPDDPAPPQGPR